MIVVRKLNEKEFSVNENGTGEQQFASVYFARKTQNGMVILAPIAARNTEGFSAHFDGWEIDGRVPASAREATTALNEFVGNFKRAGGTAETTPVIEPLSVRENGEYTAPAGVDGFNPVTVRVDIPEPPEPPPPTDEWRPHPDWWDIKQIFETDTNPDKRFIMLFSDSHNSITINSARIGNSEAYYRTSDGKTYNGSFIHTWDKRHDKPCDEGYKTRFILVCSPNAEVACDANADVKAMYIYIGNESVVNSMKCGNTSVGLSNTLLRAIKCHSSASTTFIAFNSIGDMQLCYALEHFEFPEGQIGVSGIFFGCSSLRYAKFSAQTNVIMSQAFQGCSSLKSITIPNSVNFLMDGTGYVFTRCTSLLSINIERGWSPDVININVSDSTNLSYSSLINFLNNFGSVGSMGIIKLGAENIAKLTPQEIAIGTNKGLTITA
jgi:hypothetical protein